MNLFERKMMRLRARQDLIPTKDTKNPQRTV